MHKRSANAALLAAMVTTGCAGSGTTLYTGPVFLTGDAARPVAHAVEVDASGHIVALHDAVPAGRTSTRIEGAIALPGLHDAHLHVIGVGFFAARVQLRGATSPADVVQRVQTHLGTADPGPVIQGFGWDQSRFPGAAFPTADDLAPLGDQRPVVLTRVDGHAVWVNRKALSVAGVDRDTPDPQGGKILRAADGTPTGVLVDNAMGLVTGKLPKPDLETERGWYWKGLEQCAADGLTGVHDMGVKPALLERLLQDVRGGRIPPVRVFVYLEGSDAGALAYLKAQGPGPKQLAPRVWLMGVKLFADGSMGSRGAALLEDYSDAPGSRGHLIYEPEELARRVGAIHDAGYQVAVHAIGDRGARVTLDAIEAAQAGRARRGPPHRLEHAQMVHPDDFARIARTGVVASMQPTHATSDMRWAEARVGPGRIAGMYAWRTMLERGIPVVFGSDAPIESQEPTRGLYAAVTRQDHEGKPAGGWKPGQRMSFAEAVAAFTAGAADAVGRSDLGRLSVGALFDVTVFEADLRTSEPRAWLKEKPRARLAEQP